MYYQIRVYTLRKRIAVLANFPNSERTCRVVNIIIFEKFPVITPFILFEGEGVYIRGVPNVCLSKHRCQKRSDWMFTINHPIAVNITNKYGLRNK